MSVSPGRPQTTQRSDSVGGGDTPALSHSLSELVIYTVVCIAVLLAGQFFVGHVLILVASGPFGLETERRTAITDGFQELLSQRRELHASHASDFAHRDRLANAFASSTPGPAVHEIFGAREPDLKRFDLVLAVDEKNRLLYGEAELRDRRLEKEFLEITALKVRDLQPERESEDPTPLRAATGPLYWHYTVAHGEHIYLLTLAAVCDERGYPVQKGFVLFAERLETLLADARRQLNLKSASVSSAPIATAYASVPLEAYGDASPQFYISLEPQHSVAALARRLLHALLIIEALLAFALLRYGLPYIYRDPGDAQSPPLPAKSSPAKSEIAKKAANAKANTKAGAKTAAKSGAKPAGKANGKTPAKSEGPPAEKAAEAAASSPPVPAGAGSEVSPPDAENAAEQTRATNTKQSDPDPNAAESAPNANTQTAVRADDGTPTDGPGATASDREDSPTAAGNRKASPDEQAPANDSAAEPKAGPASDERTI